MMGCSLGVGIAFLGVVIEVGVVVGVGARMTFLVLIGLLWLMIVCGVGLLLWGLTS